MSDSEKLDSGAERPDKRLTRRSLVAAAGILAAVGPAAAGKALANGRRRRRDYDHDYGRGKCFLAGTRVLTPDGEVPVEALRKGDLVVTESGVAREVRWIGTTTIKRNGDLPFGAEVLPIRISKGALGRGRPYRDLYLSPAHMLHLDGVLIPVGDLVNGMNITAADIDADEFVYYHVALDRHDVLMAEGAPCESLLVTAESGAAFDNAEEYAAIYGRAPELMALCAPIAAYNGGRGALKSRLRSAIAPVIDLRRPADIVRDSVEARAELARAA